VNAALLRAVHGERAVDCREVLDCGDRGGGVVAALDRARVRDGLSVMIRLGSQSGDCAPLVSAVQDAGAFMESPLGF